ncbi:MAG: DUF2867 domain-containing protein [Prevotellaceae bacterium]|jgi:hypothetical protein|nr:DUF2867 domain-containing protein [Prevotellaceae bacterium]
MKLIKSSLPENAQTGHFLPAGYVEAYAVIVPECSRLTPDNILVAMWTDFPKWLRMLFTLRDWLVKPFGLKAGSGGKNAGQKLEAAIRAGNPLGLMTVPAKTADETVIRLTDKHLTAELSVHSEKRTDGQRKISIITLVHFHSAAGKMYFFVIRPFHKIIVKTATKRSLKRLQAGNSARRKEITTNGG